MPYQDNDTLSLTAEQLYAYSEQQWQDVVRTWLPADLEEQAQRLKAFQRARHLPSATALLRGLLCYSLTQFSLRELSVWGQLSNVSPHGLSHQGWHKHVLKASPWLEWIFNTLLRSLCPPCDCHSRRLLLIDATHLSCVGAKGITWRFHTAYDLLSGHIAIMNVTDVHTAEGLTQFAVHQGDVLVADGAYSRAHQVVVTVLDQLADVALRWSPAHLSLYEPDAKAGKPAHRIDARAWLEQLPIGIHERQALIIDGKRRVTVRIVAQVPTAEQAERLREKKRREARDKGRTVSENALFFAGFLLVITTLPAEQWSAQQISELYRCRWQIEVLFKRMKQVLSRHRLSCSKPETACAQIFALLIGWLLVEDQVEELRQALCDGDAFAEKADAASSWQLASLCFHTLSRVIEGWWDLARLRQIIHLLRQEFKEQRARPLLEHDRRACYLRRLCCGDRLDSVFSCSSA